MAGVPSGFSRQIPGKAPRILGVFRVFWCYTAGKDDGATTAATRHCAALDYYQLEKEGCLSK